MSPSLLNYLILFNCSSFKDPRIAGQEPLDEGRMGLLYYLDCTLALIAEICGFTTFNYINITS